MSNIYQYTGTPYTKFTGGGDDYSSANHIVMAVTTPTALAAGMSFSDPLPEGTKVAIGDGTKQYSDLSLGKTTPPSGSDLGGSITLSVELSTDSTGRIVAWAVNLYDDIAPDGLQITTGIEIISCSVASKTPLDQSSIYVEPTVPGPVEQGSSNVPGNWKES